MKLAEFLTKLQGLPDNADIIITHSGFRAIDLKVINKIANTEQIFTSVSLHQVKQPGGTYRYQ